MGQPKLPPITHQNVDKLVDILHILVTATATALAHSLNAAPALQWAPNSDLLTPHVDTAEHPVVNMLRSGTAPWCTC